MDLVAQLVDMGFPLNACKRAAYFANNDLEAAMNWLCSNIDDPDIIGRLCERSNLNQQAILNYAYSNAAEKKYEHYTNFAIEKGVFGAPSYIVDGELFWGQDRLDFVSEKLK